MTKDELAAEITAIRDLLGATPEIAESHRADISLDKIGEFFNMCDRVNAAISDAFGRLDELTVLELDDVAG